MRWQAFEMRLYGSRFRQHRLYWARWLCREWNRNAAPGQRLTEFRIAYMLERTPPPGSPFAPVEQRVLWTQQCSAPPPARASDRDDGAALDGDVWRP